MSKRKDTKSPAVASALDALTAMMFDGRTRSDALANLTCVSCGLACEFDSDDWTDLDRKEWGISGLCPKCFPTAEPEEDLPFGEGFTNYTTVYANGGIETHEEDLTWEQCQTIVGGGKQGYIQIVPPQQGYDFIAYVNEDGMFLNLPRNEYSQEICALIGWGGDFFGDIVIVTRAAYLAEYSSEEN